MIASLPMYDLPPLQEVNDRFWQAIRTHLGDGPDALSRSDDLWQQWLAPDLILSQTCGYPYRARLHGRVGLVGTPDFDLPGCPPGHYNSVFVVRADDPRETLNAFASARFAYNEAMSQSGWAAPQTHVRVQGFSFDTLVQTGAHRASMLAVSEGRADIAALDAQTWRLLQRHDPACDGVRELARTAPTPALPYITALGRDGAAIFAAIAAAIAGLDAADRAALGLRAIVAISPEAYLAVPTPPSPAMT